MQTNSPARHLRGNNSTGKFNDQLGINALRHHAATDAPSIDFNEEHAAESALTKATIDYIELRGQKEPFVVAFLNWLWVNRDGQKMMVEYNALPAKIKRLKT